ncbi:hypothetical protein BH20ACI2_BH20ACI2_17230 [soil metagenome]
MEDTTSESRQLIHDIIMSKTVEERFLMCAELYEEAKEFAKVGMPKALAKAEQDEFIFRRIHGMTPKELVDSQ